MPGCKETLLIIPMTRICRLPRTLELFLEYLGAAATGFVQLALVDSGTMFCAAIAAFRFS